MNWDTLICETARRANRDYTDTKSTLDALFDVVIERMETDDIIQLRPDFGLFEMREAGGEKNDRNGILPKCRRTPVFKKANTLKRHLRQDDVAYLRMLRDNGRAAQAERLVRRREG